MHAIARLLLFLAASAFATCPNGTIFESQFNKCYQYISDATSFPLAEKNCEFMGGSLVSISNSFENSFVSLIASEYDSSQPFWIGINSLYYSNWTWVNGDNSTFVNWASHQPANGKPCGAGQTSNSQWTTEVCNTAMPYMCQIRPYTGGPCSAGRCSPGYYLNPNSCKCYKFLANGLTYNQSVAACANESATLPTIINQPENHWIVLFMNYYSRYSIWLGLQCTSNASCMWQDGTPMGYSNFNSGGSQANQLYYLNPNNEYWFQQYSQYTEGCLCQKPGIPQ